MGFFDGHKREKTGFGNGARRPIAISEESALVPIEEV